MARRDAQAIKQGMKIKHAVNGAVHLITGSLVAIFYGVAPAIAWLCECAVVFDVALALFRGLSPFYITMTPKAWKDIIEQWIFGKNGVLPKLVYIIIFFIFSLKLWNYF